MRWGLESVKPVPLFSLKHRGGKSDQQGLVILKNVPEYNLVNISFFLWNASFLNHFKSDDTMTLKGLADQAYTSSSRARLWESERKRNCTSQLQAYWFRVQVPAISLITTYSWFPVPITRGQVPDNSIYCRSQSLFKPLIFSSSNFLHLCCLFLPVEAST